VISRTEALGIDADAITERLTVSSSRALAGRAPSPRYPRAIPALSPRGNGKSGLAGVNVCQPVPALTSIFPNRSRSGLGVGIAGGQEVGSSNLPSPTSQILIIGPTKSSNLMDLHVLAAALDTAHHSTSASPIVLALAGF